MLAHTTKWGLQRAGSCLMLQQRSLATQTNQILDLDYSKVSAESSSNLPPLIICHGLFGSKQNWKSLARAFSKRLGTDVYSLVRQYPDRAGPYHPVSKFWFNIRVFVGYAQPR